MTTLRISTQQLLEEEPLHNYGKYVLEDQNNAISDKPIRISEDRERILSHEANRK